MLVLLNVKPRLYTEIKSQTMQNFLAPDYFVPFCILCTCNNYVTDSAWLYLPVQGVGR